MYGLQPAPWMGGVAPPYTQVPQQPYGAEYTQTPNSFGGGFGAELSYVGQGAKGNPERNVEQYTNRDEFQQGGNDAGFVQGAAGGGSAFPPKSGLGGGGFGSYGMNSAGGFGGMMGAGGSMRGPEEPPPMVLKLFSSRRDRSQLMSQSSFNRRPSQYSLRWGSYEFENNDAAIDWREPARAAPIDTSGLPRDPQATEVGVRAVSNRRNEGTSPRRPQSPVGNGADARYGPDDQKTKGSEKEVSQNIPYSSSIGMETQEPPRTGNAFGGGESLADMGSAVFYGSGPDVSGYSAGTEDDDQLGLHSRSSRVSSRRRSSSLGRPRSAHTIMSIAEFPQGDEVQDALAAELAQHRQSAAPQVSVGGRHPTEFGKPADITKSLHGQSEGDKPTSVEEQKNSAPQAIEPDEKTRRQEEQKRFDEELKNKNEQERLHRKAEERRRFEDARRHEEQREEERVKGLATNAEAVGVSEPKPRLVASACGRARPTSRRGSLMRAIPEQPPDLEVGVMKDNMSDTLVTSRDHTLRRVSHNVEEKTPHSGAARPKEETVEHTKREKAQEEESRRQPSHDAAKQKRQQRSEARQEKQQQETREHRTPNAIKTLVLLKSGPQESNYISAEGNSFTYRGKQHEATAVVFCNPYNISYRSSLFNDIRDSVCDGHNASIISVEAPKTGAVFNSPVWSGLMRIVSGVLRNNRNLTEGTAELTAAFGFIHKDKVRDLFVDNNSCFEKLVVHPSPIYGPRIPHLYYGKVTSDAEFEEVMSSALRRANADPVLSTTEGMAVAFILSRQCRIVTNEAGEKTCDVVLSSLVVASAGGDPVPFEKALARHKNEYSMLFHLVLGGPCNTCFLLHLSMAEEENGDPEVVEKLIELHDKMHSSYNYPLRSGSVMRFVKYVESANKEAVERLRLEDNPERRNRLERYVEEQAKLLSDANKMLAEVREELRAKFPSLS
ncbi:uncharacterized protein Tco025E_07157 [Trypanosoma conorhini]|uniref:Uncharacterized protein n=1 Tax=Trypanosoma conorhini TaxID=83891 RepID=A0A422NTV5_9TRYP|nr:uncharacterized protein Tco025E_07157 [Trypanosoma conorhini]RNF08887.1 hypothetical protein Tco025E_07157 [Trypanosoma conorhini]